MARLYTHSRWLFIFLLGSWIVADAQISQLVRGSVRTEENQPISQAQIRLVGVDSTYQQTSNEAGGFEILVYPGRYIIEINGEGYSKTEEELLVVAGKATVISIELRALPVSLQDIEIRAPQNIAEIPGAYAISIEKTMRVPANFFDPVRMAISLPGVVPTNDQSNSISIKGYSPNALSWRLQGLDIVNPNHLANAGTLSDKPMANGGGVSILSSQVLDKTSFYSGALPIQYGNALSGAMDMSLRAGNKSKREHTIQASLIGIDLATEGPMGKVAADGGDAKSSYLVNYRYSTVGLLSLAGVNFGDEKINFQDLTFHLDFDQKKGRHLSVFGFGGLSYNRFDRKPEAEWETEKDRYDIDFDGKVFGLGFSSTLYSGLKSSLKFGAAASGQEQIRKSQSQLISLPPQQAYVYRELYASQRLLISSSLDYSYRFSPAVSILTGVIATSIKHDLAVETVTQLPFNPYVPNLDGLVNGIFWQPYFNTEIKTRVADINMGLRYVHFDYNGSSSVEPRVTIATNILKGRLVAAYGLTSQIQQTQIYLAPDNSNNGLNKAHQYSLSYRKVFSNQLSLGLSGFYHQLFNIAVSGQTIPFSVLNQMDEFVNTNLSALGFGKNKGIELALEKQFSNNLYFLGGASLYESQAAGSNKVYYTSRYNGKFTSSLSGGKEWTNRKQKVFGIHARALYLGGLRQPSISESGSAFFGTTVYDNENSTPISKR